MQIDSSDSSKHHLRSATRSYLPKHSSMPILPKTGLGVRHLSLTSIRPKPALIGKEEELITRERRRKISLHSAVDLAERSPNGDLRLDLEKHSGLSGSPRKSTHSSMKTPVPNVVKEASPRKEKSQTYSPPRAHTYSRKFNDHLSPMIKKVTLSPKPTREQQIERRLAVESARKSEGLKT